MHQECELSIITINYNGLGLTCALLDSIPRREDIEVIVVDNASRDDEGAVIAARYPHVTVVRSQENLGFAGGNNLGIQAAHGKYLFFINNDTELSGQEREAEIAQLISRLKSHPGIGMVCPKIRFFQGNRPIQFAGYTPLSRITMRNRSIGFGEADQGQYDTPHPTPYAHGAAMLVSRETLQSVGLMPTCYFLYYEELDWSISFTRAGYEIWYDPCLTVYHKESQTTGQDSPVRTYYITRNRLLFARRNLSLVTRWLTYAYLLSIVALRDLLRHTLHRRADLAAGVVSGICDFIRGIQGQKRP